jgi:hypothetical protein
LAQSPEPPSSIAPAASGSAPPGAGGASAGVGGPEPMPFEPTASSEPAAGAASATAAAQGPILEHSAARLLQRGRRILELRGQLNGALEGPDATDGGEDGSPPLAQ